ncbi:MAG: O-antigen ligase family protein, partial [Pirellulales bacterium]|nr:O-antigen ligase family protein [Pirellulales bacterium]
PWHAGYRLRGSLHTNVLASQAVVAALVAFAFLQQSRRPWLLRSIFVAMILAIVLTKTRGALATTLVGMSAIYLVGRPLRSSLLVGSLVCVLVSGTMLLLVVAGPGLQSRAQNALLLGRAEGATTLTGRLPLWKTLWRESREHRSLGFGYGAFWTTDRMEKFNKQLEWYPGHSHSVYMQTLLDVGFVGIAFVGALVLASSRRAATMVRVSSDPSYKFFFGFLVAGFVDGLVEVSYVYPRGLGLLVAMVMFSLVMVHAPLGKVSPARNPRNDLLTTPGKLQSELSC